MENIKLTTKFAPPERDSFEKIMGEHNEISTDEIFNKLYSAIPNVILILNKKRQTVYYNPALANLLNIKNEKDMLGLRPGELLHCTHSNENDWGCGTSEHCCTCGAVKAILKGLDGVETTEECRITVKVNEQFHSLDLKVTATPIDINNKRYAIFYIEDISDEKRRKILENIFFHDVINTASNLQNIADLLKMYNDPKMFLEMTDLIDSVTKRLIDEIITQRDLLAAENNELPVNISEMESSHIVEETISQYSGLQTSNEIKVIRASESENFTFRSDPVLLGRVIGNMIKNAIEASKQRETIIVKSIKNEDGVIFSVNNPGHMPQEIQLQIFSRSFSTKGKNRGIGTYSIKLLTERYLRGKAGFSSEPDEGTTFFIVLPENL